MTITTEQVARGFVSWRQTTEDFTWTEPTKARLYRFLETDFEHLLSFDDPYEALPALANVGGKVPMLLEMWGKMRPINEDEIEDDDWEDVEFRRVMVTVVVYGSDVTTAVAWKDQDEVVLTKDCGKGLFGDSLAIALGRTQEQEA